VDMLDGIKAAKAAGASAEQLRPLQELHRKAQWRLDFVAAENSMGFHAPQELARVLAESIDLSRQAQVQALTLTGSKLPATTPPKADKPAAKDSPGTPQTPEPANPAAP